MVIDPRLILDAICSDTDAIVSYDFFEGLSLEILELGFDFGFLDSTFLFNTFFLAVEETNSFFTVFLETSDSLFSFEAFFCSRGNSYRTSFILHSRPNSAL